MSKKIVLIAGSVNTKNFLLGQLKEFILDEFFIEAYSQEEGIQQDIKCDLLIFSSQEMKDELEEMKISIECSDIVVCERSINFDFIDQVANIPVNEEVLLVNDEKETACSSINDLIELGLSHIKYYPYYPGIGNYKKLKIAITPGEPDKVPSCVTEIIDLGPRIININSMYVIMDKINLDYKDATFITKKYMKKIINVSKRVSAINNNVNALNGYLNNIIHNLVNGILIYDEDGFIKYSNEKMKMIFSSNKELINKNIRNIIDRDLYPYFLSSETFENKKIDIMGVTTKVSKFIAPNGKDIVVTTDRDEKEKSGKNHNQNLLLKGHVAKYDFENIIGSGKLIAETKETALKLSRSDLSVLIEGESGTGKELLQVPYIKIPKEKTDLTLQLTAALFPDELIESELFGYEEGSFTGAKKGGKIGLFELADGGTIFLDEIGDVSPKVQTKLLRVLQEKEIMPIGGTSIRKVDARIIAATNKNLRNMVLEKEFRADLYYRLKIGYLYLPPLRERLCDIDGLVSYFIKMETAADIRISKKVTDEFMKYKWLGNVRELESTIKYMIAVRTGNVLEISDLPDRKFFEETIKVTSAYCDKNEEDYNISSESIKILNCIYNMQSQNIAAGREKISVNLKECGYNLTSSQVRTRLCNLENQGYITKSRGRQGTVLTDMGINVIKNYKF